MKLLIDKAVQLTDPEEKKTAIIYIGRLMRTFYLSWNKDLPDEAVIVDHLRLLSNNQLDIDLEKVKEQNLFNPLYKEREQPRDNIRDRNSKRPKKRPGGGSNSGKRRKN